ncbi:uncharacterized protein FOMMEDRAFT_155612 [Fomitiporia mediterranea MF3/22]|uniref:uncharacterized protein n=1 Tax=Fomitiporia mediterranea (strain MF3/22) TaxID=694068 RepID=UPI00044081AE|nr:uncharacterized protein FOMMEDRAFT_155612 [Fomitiporia mediterranea MF3/22]EJD04478.1 hypothetical protein FOMMEDRAFT_155612 [Fomitiporia mediterranea MF3/22]
MARQVVSYDDLDVPPGVSSEAAPIALTADSTSGVNVHDGAATASPPTKKRKHDDGGNENVRDIGGGLENSYVNNQTGSETTGNQLSIQVQSMPPKPQVKKRNRNKRRSGVGNGDTITPAVTSSTTSVHNTSYAAAHWDEPGAQDDGISYDDDARGDARGIEDIQNDGLLDDKNGADNVFDAKETQDFDDDEEEDESRELTHEEIWDDSALIAAWNAANEEYEAIHGKSKRWKKDRVHKSPLWYNIPPEKSRATSSTRKKKVQQDTTLPLEASGATDEADESVPLNFETFVPTHDASLAFPGPTSPPAVPEVTQANLRNITSHYSMMLPASTFPTAHGSGDTSTSANLHNQSVALNPDEAFSRALGAMYWCGYWTAVYHVQRGHERGTTSTANNIDTEYVDEAQEQEQDKEEELVSTQR